MLKGGGFLLPRRALWGGLLWSMTGRRGCLLWRQGRREIARAKGVLLFVEIPDFYIELF
jgi:hypothetical protein